MRLALIVAAVALPLTTSIAQADAIDDSIDARRAYFSLLGANIGPLAAMAKGEVDYDVAGAELHAANLAYMASYNALPHFPEGSSIADRKGKTRSLAKIWEDFDDFIRKNEAFAEATRALREEVSKGRAELGAAVGKLGGTCKACHDDYRAKDF